MSASLARELRGREVVVCCGSGGVGKTTTSAALGMAMVRETDQKVLVLTIDPAQRLATAMGIPEIGSEPVRVSTARMRRAGIEPGGGGELWAAMLDARSVWADVVERYAPDRATAKAIKANRFYRGISDAFVGSQEYIAMEALYELHHAGEYDVIVIDTPPSRNALDFIQAPSRVSDFVGKRFIGWLSGGTRFGFRAIDFAAVPLMRIAGRVLGTEALGELREFATLIRELYDGVQTRGRDVYKLLRSDKTGFVVVTTLEPAAFGEAEFFTSKLRQYAMPLRGIVVNRVLPEWLDDAEAARVATALQDDDTLAGWLGSECNITTTEAGLTAVAQDFLTFNRLAIRDAKQLSRLARLGHVDVVRVPLMNDGIADLEGLAKIAALL